MSDTAKMIAELHRPAEKPKEYRKVVVNGINDTWGLDLAVLTSFAAVNNGYNYWFVCEDIFSRYCWAVPIRKKSAKATMDALQVVLDSVGGIPPRAIWADLERGWYGKDWGQALRNNDVELYTTYSPVGVAPVERLIRTLKNRLWPLMEAAGSYKWVDLLPKVVHDYNNTVHSALGMTPQQATDPANEAALWHHQYDKVVPVMPKGKPRYHSGEWVRISVVKGKFERGFQANWSDEAFQVRQVLLTNPYTYLLRAKDGEDIIGSFYEAELQHTDVPNATRPTISERELSLIKPPKKTDAPALKRMRTLALKKATPEEVAVPVVLPPSSSGRARKVPARLLE